MTNISDHIKSSTLKKPWKSSLPIVQALYL